MIDAKNNCYIIYIPVSDVYFQDSGTDTVSWCNNIMDCKKFPTEESARNCYNKLLADHPRTYYTNGKVRKINYDNGITTLLD